MASWTDQLTPFNPYISEIPVDDYVRVGMQKQQEYNQGVQRVQGDIDQVAGLDVVKPEQKAYLQQRVGQLQGQLTGILSQDFSNNQIVNSVGSLTGKIASDPIIQNAVSSTMRYKQGLSKMKEAQDKGQSSPSNEWAFNSQVQSWLNDKDVKSSFNGEYTPHVDVDKKILGAIKELKPDATLEDIPYSRGQGGKILLDKDGLPSIDLAMMQKSLKGVSPERLHAAIQANLDPNDLRQLQIDGGYTYRGVDKQGLKQITDDSYNYRLGQINDSVRGLMVDRQTNISDPQHVAQVDAEIQRLKDKAVAYQSSYKQDIDSMDKNPEGYKSSLYMQNWMSKFDEGYSYAENSLTYKENPFFMAAEKRRENNIKFAEFQLNKELEGVKIGIEQSKLGIEQAKLGIEQQKLEIEKNKAGLGGGAGGGLKLFDAVLAPMNEGDLKSINTAGFLSQTKEISDNIDTQKMALLAQVSPDLVHMESVKGADGNYHDQYMYNVAGKDPNVVKDEAEATVLKYKESYDKGEALPDGVKTYFDNLGNAEQRINNRKAAINNINSVAGSKYNLAPVLKNIPTVNITSASNTNYSINGEDMLGFTNKLNTLLESAKGQDAQYALNIPDSKVNELFTSPKERVMFNSYRKFFNGENMNTDDHKLVDNIHKVMTINPIAGSIKANKDEYTDDQIRNIVGAKQPVDFTIGSFDATDKGRVRSVVGNLMNDMETAGKGNPNPNYDSKNASKMLDDEKNTTYSLVAKGGGNYALRMTNGVVAGTKPVEMDITRSQATTLFGQNRFFDDFESIREALNLSKSTGKWTTDVQGKGQESAFTLRTPNITNYGVKYHVEEPLKDGGLQVKLYIYDKEAKKWTETTPRFGQLLNEAQVTAALSNLTDQQITQLLGKK